MDKAPGAFLTISEVADEIDVPQHVLRFWESRFAQIRPMKRGGGRRFYRPEDVALLRGVRHLLYGEGYTIRGVQRILREQGLAFVQEVWRDADSSMQELEEARAEDDDAAASTVERPGPDLSSLSVTAPRADRRSFGERPQRRVEPALAPVSAEPPPKPTGLGPEAGRALHAALDELVACRRLLEAALADNQAENEANSRTP